MKKGLSIKTMAVGLLLSSMVACTGNKTSRRYLLQRRGRMH